MSTTALEMAESSHHQPGLGPGQPTAMGHICEKSQAQLFITPIHNQGRLHRAHLIVWLILFYLLQTQPSIGGGLPKLQVTPCVLCFPRCWVCTHSALAVMAGLPCQQNQLRGLRKEQPVQVMCLYSFTWGNYFLFASGFVLIAVKFTRCAHKHVGNICLLFPVPRYVKNVQKIYDMLIWREKLQACWCSWKPCHWCQWDRISSRDTVESRKAGMKVRGWGQRSVGILKYLFVNHKSIFIGSAYIVMSL